MSAKLYVLFSKRIFSVPILHYIFDECARNIIYTTLSLTSFIHFNYFPFAFVLPRPSIKCFKYLGGSAIICEIMNANIRLLAPGTLCFYFRLKRVCGIMSVCIRNPNKVYVCRMRNEEGAPFHIAMLFIWLCPMYPMTISLTSTTKIAWAEHSDTHTHHTYTDTQAQLVDKTIWNITGTGIE